MRLRGRICPWTNRFPICGGGTASKLVWMIQPQRAFTTNEQWAQTFEVCRELCDVLIKSEPTSNSSMCFLINVLLILLWSFREIADRSPLFDTWKSWKQGIVEIYSETITLCLVLFLFIATSLFYLRARGLRLVEWFVYLMRPWICRVIVLLRSSMSGRFPCSHEAARCSDSAKMPRATSVVDKSHFGLAFLPAMWTSFKT